MPESKLYSERTNLRVILGAIVVSLIGVVFLFLSTNWQWLSNHPNVQTVVRELGGLLIASVAIASLWEFVAKRAFLAELMAKAKLAEEVRAAGLVTITTDFQRGIDWAKLFKTVTKLDIFFAYGGTWRGSNTPELRALALRPGVRIRVVLPDPEDNALMHELGRRFNTTNEDIKRKILDAVDDFKKIFSVSSQSTRTFSLWYLPSSPVLSFYRFDHVAIIALYNHRKERGGIPTFVVQEGGKLYDFIRQEFDSFIREPNGLARRVYPTT